MSYESKHANAKAKLDKMYSELDERCGFKDAVKKKELEEKKNSQHQPQIPTICKTCNCRAYRCWNGYKSKGICRELSCQVYSEDTAEKKRLEEIAATLNKLAGIEPTE